MERREKRTGESMVERGGWRKGGVWVEGGGAAGGSEGKG